VIAFETDLFAADRIAEKSTGSEKERSEQVLSIELVSLADTVRRFVACLRLPKDDWMTQRQHRAERLPSAALQQGSAAQPTAVPRHRPCQCMFNVNEWN